MSCLEEEKMSTDVSVVIPYYNDSKTIERALSSVKAQTLRPFEVIIVNDASMTSERDRLEEIVRKNVESLNLRILDHKLNSGPATARNSGWEKAAGEFIAFLDADDSWFPQKLELQVLAASMEDLAILGTKSVYDSSPGAYDSVLSPRIRRVTVGQQLFRNRFRTSSILLRRDLPVRFKNDWRYAEDYDVWCRILIGGNKGAVLDLPLTAYHKSLRSSAGLSGNYLKMFAGELRVYRTLKEDRLIGFFDVVTCYTFSILRFVRRVFLISIDKVRSRGRGKTET
jgi:teichuronic acid biosynthesis glycosyltransferase TuaG